MKSKLKSWLLRNKFSNILSNQFRRTYWPIFLFYFNYMQSQQIGNYVSNGSFEEFYNCDGPAYPLSKAKSWLSIDSVSVAGVYLSVCNSKVPLNAFCYQRPKTGNAYVASGFYDKFGIRGYLKNRLKSNLQLGKVYCVRFYVNITNNSPRGIDGFGAYFGGNSIDTISYCNVPLSYLNPQVKNPLGNVIADTMNWVPITGTFVANGTEKYVVIGNFLSDAAVSTVSIGGPYFPQNWTDVCIDDVSCIEMDAPAYAGDDKTIFVGDSAFIGRQPDFAIDKDCIWYKLPNTTTAIDTISGLWVKPVVTSTYVVKQNLECGSLKWDTVVIYMDAVGIEKLNLIKNDLKLFPNPAQNILQIQFTVEVENEFKTISIYNKLGQLLREEELILKNKVAILKTNDLENGVYVLKLHGTNLQTVSKRFVINR